MKVLCDSLTAALTLVLGDFEIILMSYIIDFGLSRLVFQSKEIWLLHVRILSSTMVGGIFAKCICH